MGFFGDFADGFTMPFKYVYSKFEKADRVADNLADAAGGAAGGLANLLTGNSNILVYGAIFVAAVVILPVVLQKVL